MGTPIVLYLIALAVRLILIALFPDPAYPDSYYYTNVAQALAAGRGFEIDFVWVFAEVGGMIPADPTLPIPSNAHWMPLASLVQVPFIWLLGPTAVASALPFAILGALAAPLAHAIARDAGAREYVATGAGLLVAIPVLTTPFMVQPDNFSLFQPLVAGSLWLGARGLKGSNRAFAVAGLLAGLATLSRNDGVLVLAALGVAFLWSRWRGPHRISVAAAVACVGLFVLVMAPWWLRQLDVFGQLSPSTASGKVLFLRNIDEWNSIDTPATLDWFLGQGAGPLVTSRILGFVAAVGVFGTLVAGWLLLPFMLVGGWLRRRSVDFGPFFVYAALLFAFSAVVSAIHVPGGTFIHSAVALVPHAYILALEGIVAAVAYVAARRRGWTVETAGPVFVGAAVVFAIISTVGATLVVHARYADKQTQRQAIAAALDAAGAPQTDRIMSIDPSGMRYHTGRGGVVLVRDPLETIERVGRAYDVRWLVLERDETVDAAGPILAGDLPDWLEAPIYSADTDDDGELDVALYPVCFEPHPGCAGSRA